MALDFITDDIKTEAGLTDETLAKLEPVFSGFLAEQKKEWDGLANTNAEKIIAGALSKIAETTGVARNEGEKAADYIARAGQESVKGQAAEVEKLKGDYAQKLMDFKGDDATKEELAAAKQKLDDALIKLANFDELTGKAEKADEFEKKYSQLNHRLAYTSVKPTFPDTVDEYRAKAKYDEFIARTDEKFNVLMDENGIAWAIEKENVHNKKKLSDLVATDKEITELATGRQQNGTGAKPKGQMTVADVPFPLPENPSSEDISKAINEYLDKENVPKLSAERTAKFKDYFDKIKAGVSK